MYEISKKEKRWWQMISYDRILVEMEHQLNAAHETSDAHEIREAVAAIRSLCEVVLSGQPEKSVPVKPMASIPPKPLSVQAPTSLASLDGKPLVEEDGANGGSLFDF